MEAGGAEPNPTRVAKLMRVSEMSDIPEDAREKATRRVLALSVQDLDDLALKLQGVPRDNPTIDELTFDDMRSIEDVFSSYKEAKFERLSSQADTIGGLGKDETTLAAFCQKTCCCCTPCCCCAAAETNPVAHSH